MVPFEPRLCEKTSWGDYNYETAVLECTPIIVLSRLLLVDTSRSMLISADLALISFLDSFANIATDFRRHLGSINSSPTGSIVPVVRSSKMSGI
jgi:hypothetical protein